MKPSISAVISILSLTSACGPLNDMKDMKNTTNELLTVSREMSKKMDMMNKMEATTAGMGTKMDATVDEMKAMGSKMDGMREDMKVLKGMDSKMGNMNTSISGMSGDMKQMKDGLTGMASDMKDMKGSMGDMKGALGGMQKTMGNMDQNMGKMLGKLDTMGSTMGDMKTAMGTMGGNLGKVLEAMNGMKDLMGSMNRSLADTIKVMRGMDSKMGGMDKNLAKTIEVMKGMSDDALLGLSTILINDSFNHLVEHHDDFGKKVILAGEYSSAYAFQFLKGKDETTRRYRDHLINTSLNMFFGHLKSLHKGDLKIAGAIPLKENEAPENEEKNRIANLYALAFRISEINPNQRMLKDVTNADTLYSLIKEGIKRHQEEVKTKVYKGDRPDWMEAISDSGNLASIKMLMQMRFTILTMKTVAEVSALSEKGQEMMDNSWNVDYSKTYSGSIVRVNRILKAAIDTLQVLKMLDVDAVDVVYFDPAFGIDNIPVIGKKFRKRTLSDILQNMSTAKPANVPVQLASAIETLHNGLLVLQSAYVNRVVGISAERNSQLPQVIPQSSQTIRN